MIALYRKILTYPKTYAIIIGISWFACFTQSRLWHWSLYVNFGIFILCYLGFIKVYFSILQRDLEKYQQAVNTRNQHFVVPQPINSVQSLRHIAATTHLAAALWLALFPAINLLFMETWFLKLLCLTLISGFMFVAIIRRLAYKLNFSVARCGLLVLRSLALTAIVSFLPLLALITVVI